MDKSDFVSTLFNGHSNPDKVTVALTMVHNAVQQGHSATLILMAEGVTLALPHAADDIDIGMPFEPAADLLAQYLDKGGRVAVCRACLIHNGLKEDEIDPRFDIITAPQVVALLMAAQGTLQVS